MTDDDLRALFQEQADPPNPLTPDQIRARAATADAPPGHGLALVAAAILLSGAMIAVALWTSAEPDLRARGPAEHGEVTLSWVVEGAAAPRLASADIGPGERVIFRIGATAPGYLCVFEESPSGFVRVIPATGGWQVEPGEHTPRLDGALAAFISDLGPGTRRYRAALDLSDPACGAPVATATTRLAWLAE